MGALKRALSGALIFRKVPVKPPKSPLSQGTFGGLLGALSKTHMVPSWSACGDFRMRFREFAGDFRETFGCAFENPYGALLGRLQGLLGALEGTNFLKCKRTKAPRALSYIYDLSLIHI